jgi:type IV pilus assembly protein PilA
MIVVAIIAILAAIAIPAYQNYLIRSQVSEGVTLADGAETAMAEYYSNKGSFPGSALSAGIAQTATSISGKYVQKLEIDSPGYIKVTFSDASPQEANKKINGATLTLSPVASANGDVHWVCNGTTNPGTIDPKYLPSTCRQ